MRSGREREEDWRWRAAHWRTHLDREPVDSGNKIAEGTKAKSHDGRNMLEAVVCVRASTCPCEYALVARLLYV